MPSVREFLARVWGSIRGGRTDADLERELRAHLELADEASRRREPAAADARRLATIRAGGLAASLEAVRDQRSLTWLDDVARDLRHSVRALRRAPTLSAIVVATIAIGIGANTAVFAVVNSVLIEPLPYPQADRLVAIWHAAPGAEGLSSVSGDLRLSASMYFTYAEHNHTFEHIGVWYQDSAAITGVGEPEQVRTIVVSDGLLDALGVPPLVGRWFRTNDQTPSGPATAILTYGYWQRRFGGDRRIVGRTIDVDEAPREIVGVMPRGFTVADVDADLLLPARFDRARLILPGFGFQAIARLKSGVAIADAEADVARLIPIWMRSWPPYPGVNPLVYESWRIAPAIRPLKDDMVGGVRRALWVVMATIGIVLLVACANVATLLLVRVEGRQHELAIRAALGAGWSRIVRVLLVETVALSIAGGCVGVGAAQLALRFLVARAPSTLPRLHEIAIDPRVLLFAAAASLLCGVAVGLIPAWRYGSPAVGRTLAAGGWTATDAPQRHRARDLLVVAQVTLAFVLLVTAGLMIRTFSALRAVEPGFTRPEAIQMLRVKFPRSLIPEPDRVTALQQAIVDRLRVLPGVTASAFASEAPMEGVPFDWDVIEAEGRVYAGTDVPALRLFMGVSPGYFETIGTDVIAGREYTWTDVRDRRPFAVVSENLARELWGSPGAAIGRRVRTLHTAPWRQVIGVVRDVRHNGVERGAPATVYWPSSGESVARAGEPRIERVVTFVARTARAGTASFAREMQQAVWSVNPSLAQASTGTLRRLYDRSLAPTSFTMVMLGLAGTMALVLGIIGIYGVIAYAVSRRSREIGIRIALGAQRTDVTRMFVRSGLRLAAIGLPIGLGAAVALTRMMSSLLYGTSPLDPIVYFAGLLLLTAAAALASYVPARRACAVEAASSLRPM